MPKILVCDDHNATLEIMSIILSREGYDVNLSNSMVDILNMVNEIKPDILLLDIRMPTIGGDEVVKKLKSNTDTAHIPVVLFSADIQGELMARVAGADAYIAKPFELQDIIRTLKETLNKYSVQ